MSKPDYSKALGQAEGYYYRLVDSVAEEILGVTSASNALRDNELDAIFDDYSRKLCAVLSIMGELRQTVARLNRAAEPKAQPSAAAVSFPKKGTLRVATIHCPADRVTDTLNSWFENHTSIEPVSVSFTHLDRGHACVVIYRLRS